ncbi:MAG: stage V sporulation protein AC [Clostridium sp.]
MKVSKQEYSHMTDKASPGSKTLRNCIRAFLVGGLICTIGQLLFQLYSNTGLETIDARCAVSVTLVGVAAILTAFGVYDKIGQFGGAGSLVPITGFSNAVVSPAIEFKSEGHIMGIGAKMFVIAGPVLVFGITASILYGVIVFLFHLY